MACDRFTKHLLVHSITVTCRFVPPNNIATVQQLMFVLDMERGVGTVTGRVTVAITVDKFTVAIQEHVTQVELLIVTWCF